MRHLTLSLYLDGYGWAQLSVANMSHIGGGETMRSDATVPCLGFADNHRASNHRVSDNHCGSGRRYVSDCRCASSS